MSLDGALADVGGEVIMLNRPEDLSRVINRFNDADWNTVYSAVETNASQYYEPVREAVTNLISMESFFGLNLIENSGWSGPGLIITLMVAITMMTSTWLMQQRNHDPNADDRTKLTGKLMLFVMPVMMTWFTATFPAGVGLFWVTSQLVQVIVDIVLIKKDKIPVRLPFTKPREVAVVNQVPPGTKM
jgi:YidC/Oxa1 family membrane protein insertase